MRKILVLSFFISIAIAANAQTVLLNVDRATEQTIDERGPNLKKFTHFLLRAGFIASPDKPGARIYYGPSVNLAMGIRRKYKITSFYSLGYDIETQYTTYKFRQQKGKIVPDTVVNNISGRLDILSTGLGFYNRFNFDPGRGNFLGTFLDLGINGSWEFSVKAISKNKRDDGTVVKTSVRHLPYINNLNAKVYARIGFSHLSVYGSYRLTDLFKPSYNYPEMPRIIAGVELAIF